MPEITEEQLKNMTPEQIAQLQKQNCVFCHIISGRVPAKKVYEDDKAIAILDIHPASPGHVLILPKEHYAIMPQVPEDVIGHLFMVSKGISHAILRALKVQGTNIVVQNGALAGQKAPHFMIHVIPRKEGDGLSLTLPKSSMAEEHMVQVQQRLVEGVKSTFGVEQPVQEAEKPAAESKPEEKEAKAEAVEEKPVLESKPVIEQLKKIIQLNPQLKTAIKESPEQVLQVIKNQPQLKDLFADLTVEDLKEAVGEEKEEEKADLDSVSNILGALGGGAEEEKEEAEEESESEETEEDEDDSEEDEDEESDEGDDEEPEEGSEGANLDSIANMFK